MSTESFKTIEEPSSEVLFKEKKSKFYGYVFPVNNEDEIKEYLNEIRRKHPSANHVCFAWQLGVDKISSRTNDDGEPKNSAGMPIYGQIQSFALTNVLVSVVRYFGGVKLGVGGLIQAYRETARLALESSRIIKKDTLVYLEITFGYQDMSKVMKALKKFKGSVEKQILQTDCKIEVAIPKKNESSFLSSLKNNHKISIKPRG